MERDRARVESWPTTAAGGGITLTRRPAEDALRAVSRRALGKKQRGARRCEEEGKADRRDPLVRGLGSEQVGGRLTCRRGKLGRLAARALARGSGFGEVLGRGKAWFS